MAKKFFKLYVDYKDTFNLLNKRQFYILIMALINYVDTGVLPERLKPKTQMVFNALKPIIDGDAEYERIRQERIRAGRMSYKSRKNAKNKQNYANFKQNNSKN